MASFTASSASFTSVSCSLKKNQVSNLRKASLSFSGKAFPSQKLSIHRFQISRAVSNLRKASLSFSGKAFPSQKLSIHRFQISRAAKPETVEKVCEIVRKQLALPEDRDVNGESKFATLGADSLDTVEIVMGLEEEFGISVEEESAQSITTVQDAADLIEKLLEKN